MGARETFGYEFVKPTEKKLHPFSPLEIESVSGKVYRLHTNGRIVHAVLDAETEAMLWGVICDPGEE